MGIVSFRGNSTPRRSPAFFLRKQQHHHQKLQPHRQKGENTSFRSHRSSCQPLRPIQQGAGQMSPKHFPAVRNGVQKGLAPIKSRMQSDRVPETSASSQGEGKQ